MIRIAFALVFLIMGWSTYMLQNLYTEYSVDQFYPKEHSLLKDHEKITHQFRLGKESPYLYVVQLPTPGDWLKTQNIQALKELSSTISSRSDVQQIISLTAIEGASDSEEALTIGNTFDRVPASDWQSAIENNPLIYPALITKDFQSTLLAIQSKEKSKEKLEANEKEIHQLIQKSFPEARIFSAGVPLLQTRLADMIQSELSAFLGITALVFCLVFYLIFSHWSAIACAFFALIGANVFALALMGAFKIPMNAILVTLPVIVSVSVMSLLIHTLHLWSQRRKEGSIPERWSLSLSTLKEIWLPNALGILTTALGFLALAPSAIPIIGQYGLTVALILSFVALFNQLLMMVLLPFVTPKMRGWFDRPAHWALWSIQHPYKILAAMTVVLVAGTFMVSRLNFSSRLFDDLPASDKVRLTTEWIDKAFGGILTYDLSGVSSREGYWRDPVALKNLKAMARDLRAIPGVGSVVSMSDFFQGQKNQDKGQIAETLFLFSMAEKNPLNSFMTEDGKTLRISIRLKDLPAAELEVTKKLVKASGNRYFPEIQFIEGGIATYAHAINQEVARALIFDFWQPLLLIGFFLIFMFRSLKWAILSCIPNIIPPAVLIVTLAITQVSIKPGVALIFSIALGFAFNNTLYLLSRMKNLMEEGDEKPLESALLMEGNPCLFESLIMLVGFSIFLTSDFNMNKTFGAFMLISILAGFLADLVCLPAFMKVFPATYRKAASRSEMTYVAAAAIILCLLPMLTGIR
jgi:uncharacterized protein